MLLSRFKALKIKLLSQIIKPALKNKLGLLNLILSLFILYKVVLIDAKLSMMMDIISQIGYMLYMNIVAAADQFRAAILAILSLFRGDGA